MVVNNFFFGNIELLEIVVLIGVFNRLLGLFFLLVVIVFINRKYVINGRNINCFIIFFKYKK